MPKRSAKGVVTSNAASRPFGSGTLYAIKRALKICKATAYTAVSYGSSSKRGPVEFRSRAAVICAMAAFLSAASLGETYFEACILHVRSDLL